MRELKFRAWSKDTGCWCGAFSIHKSGMTSDMINAKIDKDSGLAISDAHWDENDLEVMQYTGLKDRDGKEIYEGDIIKVLGNPSEVIFINSGFAYQSRKDNHIQPLGDFGSSAYEVIGNKYE